jgi:hypothetical protein
LQTVMNTLVLAESRQGLFRLFSARHEFPGEWRRFLTSSEPNRTLSLDFSAGRFPLLFRDRNIKIAGVELFLKLPKDALDAYHPLDLRLIAPGDPDTADPAIPDQQATSLLEDPGFGNVPHGVKTYQNAKGGGEWSIRASAADLAALTIEDLYIVCHYSIGM